jgi:arginase family enzyme
VAEVAPAYDDAEIISIAAATVIYDPLTLLARRG